jgi:MurNAc alpha-1-phosphate uridylyltransferase
MKTAMIFAAGRGERLRPITDTLPKALCKIQNVPLIEHHVKHLARAGFEKIIINHAYLGGAIRAYLGNGARFNIQILYSPEPPGALETGGAIVNSRHLLGDEPFVTVNADIVTNYDFSQLQRPNGRLAHLVLVNQPSYYAHADFGLSTQGLLTHQPKQYTFSGIACFDPILFADLKPGRFSITPLIRQRIDRQQVSAEFYDGFWLDIGSVERLHSADTMNLYNSVCLYI